MLGTIVVILVILWFLGYAPLSGISIPNISLFSLNGHPITLWSILILVVVMWAIGLLPRPVQTVASILLLFWVLSTLGFLAFFAGLPNLLVIIIIIVIATSLFR